MSLSAYQGRSHHPVASLRRGRPLRTLVLTLCLVGVCALAGSLVVGVAAAQAATAARAAAPPAPRSPLADAVLVAPASLSGDLTALQDLLRQANVHALVVFPPRVAVARVSDGAALRLRADGFAVLRAGAAPPTGASAQLSQQVSRGLALIKALRAAATSSSPPLPSHAGTLGLDSDLKEPPPSADALSPAGIVPPSVATGASDAAASPASAQPLAAQVFAQLSGQLNFFPRATEPVAFAAGSVAVSIIFPQSSGAAEPSSENWTNSDPNNPGDRRAFVLTKIDTALAWWAAQVPGAALTFVVPPSGTLGAPQTTLTPYEPINHSSLQDGVWRWPIMRALGFSGGQNDSPPPEQAYDNAVRRANHTDWAFTVYVVDNLDDADGWFAGANDRGMLAYTFSLFGPYVVLTYDNGYQLDPTVFGPQMLDAILAHEIGHVFGALDEYWGPLDYSGPNLYSGYLWVRNANAERGGSTNYPCIMRAGIDSIEAYRNGQICPSTRGQVGARDSRQAGVPDVVDTAPRFTDQPQVQLSGGRLALTGTVREQPWPHGSNSYGSAFDHDISILVPHDVQYRVDGGDWTPATATDADGLFDQSAEGWALTTPPLADGHHVLDLQATTGTTRTLTRDLWVGDTPVSLALASSRRTLTYGGSVSLTVSSTSGGYPVPHLAQVVLGRVGAIGITGATNGVGLWRRAFWPRTNTVYGARFAGYGQYLGPASSTTVSVGVRVEVVEHRALSPVPLGGTMSVWGVIKPLKAHVPVLLEESRTEGASWRVVARTRTDAASHFVFAYRATHRGRILLRVHYLGDARNLGNAHLVARFSVF